MDNSHKAHIIWMSILARENALWECEFQDGIHMAKLSCVGWHAQIWAKRGQYPFDQKVAYGPEALLDPCRAYSREHNLDLWVVGQGRVLTAQWEVSLRILNFTSGAWENDYFDLPANDPWQIQQSRSRRNSAPGQ